MKTKFRKGDVVICDTRYWYKLMRPITGFDPHFMLGLVGNKPEGNSDYQWADVGIGSSPWPFDKNELTKIGRL